MYVKAIDQKVIKFPYTRNDLKKDYPNVSFPKNPHQEVLSDRGVYIVAFDDPPIANQGQVVEQASEPEYDDGRWVLKYTVRDMTEEELSHQGELVRADRNRLLSESDWTQLPDSKADKQAWADYRQSLRDITEDSSFPFVTLPEAP